MDLVDVDVVGTQSAQRLIDLPHDPLPGRVSVDLAVAPFQAHLGGDDRPCAQPGSRDCLADDLLGHPEPVYRRRIDQVDTLFQSGLDGGDRFTLVGSAPHPAAHRPGSERHARHLELSAGNVNGLGLDLLHLRLD